MTEYTEELKDWLGNKLSEDDKVILTEDGLVPKKDIDMYIGLVYGVPVTVEEYLKIAKGEI